MDGKSSRQPSIGQRILVGVGRGGKVDVLDGWGVGCEVITGAGGELEGGGGASSSIGEGVDGLTGEKIGGGGNSPKSRREAQLSRWQSDHVEGRKRWQVGHVHLDKDENQGVGGEEDLVGCRCSALKWEKMVEARVAFRGQFG